MKLSAFQLGNSAIFDHFHRKRASMIRGHEIAAVLKIYCYEISLLLGLACAFTILVLHFPLVLIAPPLLYIYANLGEMRKTMNVRKYWALDVYNPSTYTELAEQWSSQDIFAAAWKESMRKFYLMCAVFLAIAGLVIYSVLFSSEARFVWLREVHPVFRNLRADQTALMTVVGLSLVGLIAFLRCCFLSWKSLFLFEAIPENVHASRPRVFLYGSLLIFVTFFIISAIDSEVNLDILMLLEVRNLGVLIGAFILYQIFQHYLIGRRLRKLREACPDLELS